MFFLGLLLPPLPPPLPPNRYESFLALRGVLCSIFLGFAAAADAVDSTVSTMLSLISGASVGVVAASVCRGAPPGPEGVEPGVIKMSLGESRVHSEYPQIRSLEELSVEGVTTRLLGIPYVR